MNEIWKSLNSAPGYEVSNTGEVRSKNKTLTPHYSKNGGYKFVCLYVNGKPKTGYIHRLVAEAFIPGYSKTLQVNHKNKNRLDNSIENLEWCTPAENMWHAHASRYPTICPLIEKLLRLPIDQQKHFSEKWLKELS